MDQVPRQSRRWYSFSLRTLLVALTIVAVWLGWWVRTAERQKQSAAAIRELGGWVYYDFQVDDDDVVPGADAVSWVPSAVLHALGEDFFHDVVVVNMVYNDNGPNRLENSQVTDACLYRLEGFRRLRQLALHGGQATDAGLAQVARLSTLKSLYIWDATQVSDAGVAHLSDLRNLEFIHLNKSRIGDESLHTLSVLPKLTDLSLQNNHITDQGLANLRGMRHLTSLWVGMGDGRITDKGVGELAGLTNLEQLDLQGTEVTLAGIVQLAGLRNLKELYISVDDLAALRQILPNCTFPGLGFTTVPAGEDDPAINAAP